MTSAKKYPFGLCLFTAHTSRHVTEQEQLATPISKVAPLTCIRLQTEFAFSTGSSTVSKHTPSCIFCYYGLLIFASFRAIALAIPLRQTISKANKHCLMRRNLQKPPSRSRMDGSADSILWGPEPAPWGPEPAPWGPDRAPCLPPHLAESAGPPPMCKLLAGSAAPLPQSCQGHKSRCPLMG